MLASLAIGSLPGAAGAETIAVIGTGNVGAALGRRFAEAGHSVIYGAREPDRTDVVELVGQTGHGASAERPEVAVREAAVVVLAVPWEVAADLTAGLGDLGGKILIDPTNPRRIAADGLRDYPFDGSNAERIQAAAPRAHVVKAFSTLGAETMLRPDSAGGPVSIPYAGDNRNAKSVVAVLIDEVGLHPGDVGPLRYAHVIEGLHYLRANAGEFSGGRINYYLPVDPN